MTSPAITEPDDRPKGYYGVPPIHEPHWRWMIAGYFFFGGISGSSATLSACLRLFAGPRAEPLARVALWVSVAALLPCPPLLILDLRRPARFLNMVRAFRPTSPMSMGTWGFLAFSGLLFIQVAMEIGAMVLARSQRREPIAFRAAGASVSALTGTAGVFVSGYTGVLLAATAVPLWSKSPALLASLFLSSATSSAAAAVSLTHLVLRSKYDHPANAAHDRNDEPDARVEDALHTYETMAALAKGITLIAWLHSLGSTSRPLQHDLWGYVVRDGVAGAGIAAPLLLNAASRTLRPRQRFALRLIASAVTLAGVFALRATIVEGGRASANDPDATFDLTG